MSRRSLSTERRSRGLSGEKRWLKWTYSLLRGEPEERGWIGNSERGYNSLNERRLTAPKSRKTLLVVLIMRHPHRVSTSAPDRVMSTISSA